MAKLIFGCGYLGRRVAQRWLDDGQEVAAVTRSADRADELARQGIRPIVADITDPASLAALPAAETALFAVGYDRSAKASIDEVYVGGLRSALAALAGEVERFIYISSSGVYGNDDDSWVDEDSPCRPTRAGGKACLAAEQALDQHPLGRKAVVLRLAGIYGPGRIPNRRDLADGKPLSSPSEGFLNLIHVDDAAEIVLAAERHAALPSRYVVADGQPVVRGEYYAELARQLGAPPPKFEPPPAGSPAAQRAGSSKRLDTSRLKSDFNIALRYPSYKAGLAAIIAAE